MKNTTDNAERLAATDGSHASWEAQKDQWRRGNTSAQANAALRNKAVLQYIKAHPGCTREEIHTALGHGGFELLQKHRLAFYVKDSANDNARWYLESDRPRLNELEAARRKSHENDEMRDGERKTTANTTTEL